MNIINKPFAPRESSSEIFFPEVDINLNGFAFQPKSQTGVVKLAKIYSPL